MTITARNSKCKIQNSDTVALAFAFCLLPFALLATGCKAEAEKSAEPAAAAVVQVGPENVVPVTKGTVVVGPIISGELKAEKEATIRAEVGGSMVEVAVLEAQAVQKGALLGRIETRTLEDAKQSASSAVRSAENQLNVARREAERTEKLVSAGALAARDLDVVNNNVSAAEAQVADAKARLASADRALGDTVIRAPLQGIVSKRSVNAGDVVSSGTELFTIIDPSSMKLEGTVPSDDLRALRVGAEVEFTVRGYETPFHGRIERIAPQADAAGADLRVDSQRRRPARCGALRRGPCREPISNRHRRAHQRGQHDGRLEAMGAACRRREDRARQCHAWPARSSQRARQRRVGVE
jgi:RND family efflux transporter MFP subunit